MKVSKNNKYLERIDFSKIKTTIPIPDLIEVQKNSFKKFLQMELLPEEKDEVGIQAAFKSVFPIMDFRENASLEFVSYSLGNWECLCGKLKGVENARPKCKKCGTLLLPRNESIKDVICPVCNSISEVEIPTCDYCGDNIKLKIKYSPQECKDKGYTYSIPLKVVLRLIQWERDPHSDTKRLKDIKEQEVYFGEIPYMAEYGTFIINGTERVIVSQLQRSPGVFFLPGESKGYYIAKIIPARGAWIVLEYDSKNILYIKMDKRKKFPATIFFRALGYGTDEEIIKAFYKIFKIVGKNEFFYWELNENLSGKTVSKDIIDPSTKKVIINSKKKLTKLIIQNLMKSGIKEVPIEREELFSAFSAKKIEGIIDVNQQIEESLLDSLLEKGIPFEVFFSEEDDVGPVISETLKKDRKKSHEEALIEIFKKLRPSEPHNLENARTLFNNTFFNPQKYDISRIGKLKFNIKLSVGTPLDNRILSPSDWISIATYLLKLKKGMGTVDDIDHLGNRRIRSVGELVENAFRIGLLRMEKVVKERMTMTSELSTAMPYDLINSKPVIAALKEFFGTGELSQFLDQTNPLSEITHKRRLSAMGPQGLSRERAGFEVRDVHPTHYGRICPIETPEGPSIGLISSLSIYGRVNEFGFIETPYKKVENGKVLNHFKILSPGNSRFKVGDILEESELLREEEELKLRRKKMFISEPYVFYLTAWEEEGYIIAQANAPVDEKGNFTNEYVIARQGGNFKLVHRNQVNFIDLSPKQVVSVAASLIPFLEHDDANRALMGSNMQRQAVPLVKPEAPLVGTGIEYEVAKNSGSVIICRRSGIVENVDSQRIIVKVFEKDGANPNDIGTDLYILTKFKRSNQNTLINQRPLVKKGEKVEEGQILADGACTDKGELALGRNVLVAFIPWRGYNFEDAIVISEKLVKEDCYTSIHIIEQTIEARDTKLGPEEITRDIPNVKEKILRNLDEFGIVRIGAYVRPGDILVGKVAPKGETQLSPEEKLLKAIFGEKALDVKDESLYCPPGVEGTVVDVKIFSRRGIDKDGRTKIIEEEEINRMKRNLNDEIKILQIEKAKQIKELLNKEKLAKDVQIGKKSFRKGSIINDELLNSVDFIHWKKLKIEGPEKEKKINEIETKFNRQIDSIKLTWEEKIDQLKKGDELPPGVIKIIKVYIAVKRKLSEGDKMAGRHGNKGVIAKIVPEEDMPFLPDGTPIEVVLNPLGVPSRMNVGQILETHLGWAAKALGLWFSSPVFEGAAEHEIKNYLQKASLPSNGKSRVTDGLTGELFDQEITVGYIYMMKLYHLVEDKIHARSTGPYSLITQQPLGGKAQFGGQRFGEMEVWALEAYGAAYTLQEMLTVKSDDISGRWNIYDAIVKGDLEFSPGLPESVNVLIKELQSLAVNVELISAKKKEKEFWGVQIK
ncbi:MAG: DNA-directed RNA polymerase subunit beta [Acidobacteriota bacterium]